jgi:hypothetical protein
MVPPSIGDGATSSAAESSAPPEGRTDADTDQEIPGPPNRDPDSRSRQKSGIGDSLFPGRIGNRGFPPRFKFPAKKSGIGGSDSRFPSDVRASTAVDSEYSNTQPRVSCQCSHRQHAAPIDSGSKTEHVAASDEHQPQWTRNILSREYHASALTGPGSMRSPPIQGPREGTCSCHLPPATAQGC